MISPHSPSAFEKILEYNGLLGGIPGQLEVTHGMSQ